MKWHDLLALVGGEPVFTSALLRAGAVSDAQLRLQLARWTRAGRLLQLRRGVYVLAPPFRRIEPHPFAVAHYVRKNSYVSLHSALAYHALIPEHSPVVTSVTTGRPELMRTPLGTFLFKHVASSRFFGYSRVAVAEDQFAFIAGPEKALLDLVYLTPGAEQVEYLRELRLQNLDVIDAGALARTAARFAKAKIQRAAEHVIQIVKEEGGLKP